MCGRGGKSKDCELARAERAYTLTTMGSRSISVSADWMERFAKEVSHPLTGVEVGQRAPSSTSKRTVSPCPATAPGLRKKERRRFLFTDRADLTLKRCLDDGIVVSVVLG